MKKILVIPGLPRCATTSLVNILCQHPEISSPLSKEPHFFIPSKKRENLFAFESDGRIRPFSRCGFVSSFDDYKKNIRFGQERSIAIDASTLYSVHPESIEEISKFSELDPYFIILKRNPFRRAYSHYLFLVSRGEEFRTFEAAINDEVEGRYERWLLGGYIKGSSGVLLEKNIEVCFGPERMLVLDIDFSDIFSNHFIQRVSGFLGIDFHDFDFEVYRNASGHIDNQIFKTLRVWARKWRQKRPHIYDNKATRSVFEMFVRMAQKPVVIPKDIEALEDLYMKHFVHVDRS